MNDGIGWLHNTNFVDNLILVHSKWGAWNGRTQDSTIWRINRTRGRRSREWVHVTTNRLASQICASGKSMCGGRMWQFNRGVCMISHITLWWWSCLMRWRQTVTYDIDCACLWFCNSITEVCWVGFKYVKKILKSYIKKFPINFIFRELVCKITKSCVKLIDKFIRCFL